MKTTIFLIGIMAFIACGNVSGQTTEVKSSTPQQQGELNISSTPELYTLTSTWASEFNRLNPEAKINVTNNVNKKVDVGKVENLSFVSTQELSSTNINANWKMVVGRDVIVPVINAENPFLNCLLYTSPSPRDRTRSRMPSSA